MTKKQRTASQRNFTFYVLNGMISNLHCMYYEHRKSSDVVRNQIGVCLDALNDLVLLLKGEHREQL